MNEKTGKKIILFLAICIPGALILAVITVAGVFLSKSISKRNDFSAYREDFEIVENIIVEDYLQNLQNYSKDEFVYYEIIYNSDTGLYSYKRFYSDNAVEIDSKYNASIENIYTAYSNLTTDAWCGYIAIRGKESVFWNYESGYGRIIHSPNGEIPSDIMGSKDKYTYFYVLGKDWYAFLPKRHYR